MTIEDNIFKKYIPDFLKLEDFGFIKNDKTFTYNELFYENQFRAVISIDKNGHLTGKVLDEENNEEYIPLRIENKQGTFVNKVRFAYQNILIKIREECFNKKYYIYPQSNRITELIIKKYGNKPEFLWEKFEGTGIFRNPKTKKWYGIIMDVDRSKIQKGKSGIIEVLNVKLHPQNVINIVSKENFYKAYHMNKKYWISIILDESVNDEIIMKLLEESHSFSEKK
ncbi:MmcQ/YjbR family DNA-binding protein [bacterium]|nr:MmcQ/YjbR family DNA-binding protein [bacterium]